MRRSLTVFCALIAGLLWCDVTSVAQTLPNREPDRERPPALLSQVIPDQPSIPLSIAQVETRVRIHGFIAETTTTLTFLNDSERTLAGELVFPLPVGSTISGYWLDVDGELVPAVPVERKKARVAFETEVRRGVDPGLVEWVLGNNFRTRVFPILPKATRTVQVQYLSALTLNPAGLQYHHPLRYEDPVGRFDMCIEIDGSLGLPMIEGFDEQTVLFERQADHLAVRVQQEQAAVTTNLVVSFPDAPAPTVPHVIIESGPDPRRGLYFAIAAAVPVEAAVAAPAPSRVCVLWDASFSRVNADIERELDLLTEHLKRVGNVVVDVVVVRDVVEAAMTFEIVAGDSTALISHLRNLPLDGGTRLDATVTTAALSAGHTFDYAIAFTDGLANLGRDPESLGCPVYLVSSGTTIDPRFLGYLARQSGGQYFDLTRESPAQIAVAIGRAPRRSNPFGFGDGVTDLCQTAHRGARGDRELLIVTGRLTAERTTVTVNKRTLVLQSEHAGDTGLVPRLWAQMSIDELAVMPERNHERLQKLGQTFGLVTPGTSLLVLETAEQYVEHRIMPPKSRVEVYAQYFEMMETIATERKTRQDQKIANVAAMWNERVTWWETVFDVPKDFRYAAKEQDGAVRGEAGQGRSLDEARVVPSVAAERAAQRPPPGAADAPTGGGAVTGARGNTGGSLFNQVALDADTSSISETAGQPSGPAITLQAWNPETPYLTALRAAGPDGAYAAYLAQRPEFARNPAFFFDCAEYFFTADDPVLGQRVLTSILELELDDPALLRVVAHRLAQGDELELATRLFEQVLSLRPEEPQSLRDLALVVARRGDQDRAISLLQQIVLGNWEGRFPGIEVIALMELNRLLGPTSERGSHPSTLDPRLRKLLDVDVRIVLTWDADMTDIDLWVTEPSGEKCMFSQNRTMIGGYMSNDFTGGYGPEEYFVRRAQDGAYAIMAHYYGSSQVDLTGATTIQVAVFVNYGRENEQRRTITMRLTEPDSRVAVGEIEIREGMLLP